MNKFFAISMLSISLLLISCKEESSSPAGSTHNVASDMVLVAGGTFTMGDSSSVPFVLPRHSVTLDSFYIGKTEVTQGEWKSVMSTNPIYFRSVGEDAPVENVTWYDCISFCNKLSIREGKTPCYSVSGKTDPAAWPKDTATLNSVVCNFTAKGYRLPTEAEWEFAAKGGTLSKGFKFSGDSLVANSAWYFSNSGAKTHAAGTKTANELGLNDMSGNVWEWCWDWYGAYSSAAQSNPRGPAVASKRILRGGSWDSDENNCRAYHRANNYTPDYRYYDNGFRVVCSK